MSLVSLHGSEPPIARCKVCGALAVGPCRRCYAPLCGDCCVLTKEGVGVYAICRKCAETSGLSLRTRWTAVLGIFAAAILGLLALLWVLQALFG
jgi:hypothetical protein